MAKEYQERRSNFAERLKNSPTSATPIQEVAPVAARVGEAAPKIEEAQLNAWIPKELMKRLKGKALNDDKSMKICVIEAVEAYLAG